MYTDSKDTWVLSAHHSLVNLPLPQNALLLCSYFYIVLKIFRSLIIQLPTKINITCIPSYIFRRSIYTIETYAEHSPFKDLFLLVYYCKFISLVSGDCVLLHLSLTP
jgi:hypothetical protein